MWGQRGLNLANRKKSVKTKQAETVWGWAQRRVGLSWKRTGKGLGGQARSWDIPRLSTECCETPWAKASLSPHWASTGMSLLRDTLSSMCWEDLVLKLLNSVWPDMGVSIAPISGVPVCSSLLFLKLVNDAHKRRSPADHQCSKWSTLRFGKALLKVGCSILCAWGYALQLDNHTGWLHCCIFSLCMS